MKILVVEDDRKLARFLVRVLSEEGYLADACGDGDEALERAGLGIYDLLVLDWMLPGQDGITVCRELRKRGCSVPILMLTARGEVKERVLGLESGADDYLGKPFEIEELVARVRALLRRSGGHGKLQLGALALEPVDRRATLDGQTLDLSPREFLLLLYLARNAERVVPRSELLTQVWSTHFDPGSNLVEVQVSRLRDKLGEHAWMIDTVRGRGYRLCTSRVP